MNPFLVKDQIESLQSEYAEALTARQSHDMAIGRVQRAVVTLGQESYRAVQVWNQNVLPLLDETTGPEAGAQVQAQSIAAWQESAPMLAVALDAVAAASGVTRQSLLDELAQIAATDFDQPLGGGE